MSCPDKPSIDMMAYEVKISYKENGKSLVKTFGKANIIEHVAIYNRSVGCVDYLVLKWANYLPWIVEKKKIETIEINGKPIKLLLV